MPHIGSPSARKHEPLFLQLEHQQSQCVCGRFSGQAEFK